MTASAAAFSEGAIAGGFLAAFEATATGLIMAVGLLYGSRRFTQLDVACLAGVAAGLVAWGLSGEPAWALFISLSVDFIASIPTLVHSWQKPYEETLSTYAWSVVSDVLVLVSVTSLTPVIVAVPLYYLAIDGALTGILFWRRRVVRSVKYSV